MPRASRPGLCLCEFTGTEHGRIAQMVERPLRKRRVKSSSLFLAPIFPSVLSADLSLK